MLEKVKGLWEDEKLTKIIMCLGTILIFLLYVVNLPDIHTVWELVDEYGYLANAAYLSGIEWGQITNLYYGYGYSLLLVPLFWIFDSGIEIIRSAMFINIICVMVLFHVQNSLMSKLFKRVNRNVIVITSLCLCFYPYLAASVLKVLPECLLTLMTWICGLLLYLALDTQKMQYYITLAFAVSYTFFVHTRSFVFIAVLILVLLITLIQKQTCIRKIAVFGVFCVILFILGTILKNYIIDGIYSSDLFGKGVAIGNTVSISDIVERLYAFVSGFSWEHIRSLSCKVFYLYVATAGMLFVGIICMLSEAKNEWKKQRKISIETIIIFMYVLATILMILALVVNPMGIGENSGRHFYARYYEYIVGPVIFGGICYCMEKHLSILQKAVLVVLALVAMYFTYDTANYLEEQILYLDTNRMSGLSFILAAKMYYREVIKIGFVFILIFLAVIGISNGREKVQIISLMMLLLLFGLNDKFVLERILVMNESDSNYEITEYIHENYDVEEVYFSTGDEINQVAFGALQSLLGKEKLNLVVKDDVKKLETGDLLIAFHVDNYIDAIEIKRLLGTDSYVLYVVE